jgi:hypothetical protein
MSATPKKQTASVLTQLRELQSMTVSQLQERWQQLYGEPSRSRNRQFLLRRLSWRTQELAHGGLSDRAKARLHELMNDADLADLRVRIPNGFVAASAVIGTATPRRDPRLPAVGTVLTKIYLGKQISVYVREDGFEWNSRSFTSLSAVAEAITGQHWNGRLFFGLTKRSRKA